MPTPQALRLRPSENSLPTRSRSLKVGNMHKRNLQQHQQKKSQSPKDAATYTVPQEEYNRSSRSSICRLHQEFEWKRELVQPESPPKFPHPLSPSAQSYKPTTQKKIKNKRKSK